MTVDYGADLAASYAVLGEPVMVAGSSITAIWSSGYLETLGIAGTQPALRCRASDVTTVAKGAAVVRGGVSYVVRERQPLAPDELEVLLVLERA